MEVYILDSLNRHTDVVDKFLSAIWTERFADIGNFELDLYSSPENRRRLIPGTRLALTDSKRVMTVETVEDASTDSGERLLKVTGRSLEKILNDRIARGTMTSTTTEPKWVITGTPKVLANKIFHDICITGTLSSGDIITGITEANTLFPADTIPSSSTSITYEIEPQTVFSAIKKLADVYGMGFRIVRDPNTAALYFDVYMGSDRTTAQTTLPAVIFSPDLENLHNTKQLTSNAVFKNVAYVISPVGTQTVYDSLTDPSVAGFDRRVLLVKADDITDTDSTVANAKMVQRGREELAKNRVVAALDGEVSQTSQYKYGLDYNLGDLVEIRSSDGVTSNMQVTEHIFVSDREGDRSYPTLSLNAFVTPGSWLGWNPTQVWSDLTTETWATI